MAICGNVARESGELKTAGSETLFRHRMGANREPSLHAQSVEFFEKTAGELDGT
jgi:hypothetical protein